MLSARWINRLEQFDSVSITLVVEDDGRCLLRNEMSFRREAFPVVTEPMLAAIAEEQIALLQQEQGGE